MAQSTQLVSQCNASIRRVPDWTLYLLAVAYVIWLFWLGLTGGLGVEPINAQNPAMP
ncbi:MAG: hypothetical protein AAGH83_06250 [Pseudomonadota bacterium]